LKIVVYSYKYTENEIIQLKDICELITRDLNIKMNNNRKGKIKLEIQKYIKEKYKNINHVLQDTSFNNKKYKGWINLSLKF
jgi:hypothetical protein